MRWLISLVILFSFAPVQAEELFLKTFILPSGARADIWVSPTLEWLNREAVKYLPKPQAILVLAKIPEARADELSLGDQINYYIDAIATKWGLDGEKMKEVLNCESGLNQSATGQAGEIGIAQFMPDTWEKFKTEFGDSDMSIYSWRNQIELMGIAWQRGLAHHWTCWKMLK